MFAENRAVLLEQSRYLRRMDFSISSIILILAARETHKVYRLMCVRLNGYIAILEKTKHGGNALRRIRWVIAIKNQVTGIVSSRFERFMSTASPAQRKTASIGTVGSVHLLLVLLLLAGLQLRQYANSAEVIMTLGGAIGQPTTPSKLPKFMQPKVPEIDQPVVNIQETEDANGGGTQGSTNLTIPAEAIADKHAFPHLPSVYASLQSKFVRLTLSITENGSIADASVVQSSGNAELDAYIINWVRMNWVYRPALRNGVAIAVTTTAIVLFDKA